MALDYEEEVAAFEWEIPDDYNLPDVIRGHAEAFGERTAIAFISASGGRNERTYGELLADMNRFGNALSDLGVGTGDRVMHLLPRHPNVFSVQLGALAAGAVLVPCSAMLKPKDIAFRAEDCGAGTIVCHESLIEMVEPVVEDTPIERVIVVGGARRPPEGREEGVDTEERPDGWYEYADLVDDGSNEFDGPDLGAEDPMTINYTSGTTGKPKPVLHKHRWMHCFSRVNGPYWWGIDEETDLESELLWATTGTGWAKWFWSPVGVALTAGATQLIYDGEFASERFLSLIEQEGVTRLCAVPTQYRMFTQADLSAYELELTDALSAGEPLNREPIEEIQEAFDVTPRDGYGQTETVALVTNHPGIEVKPGSMGKPAPGMGTTIIDTQEEEEVDDGEIGEVAVPVDCPGVFDGYYEKPRLDERTFHGEYYRTGDLASRDEDGYFFFEGRADDIIISAGYRIGPFEVEDALVSHEAVAEAAAVESPHEERGNVVKAYVVLAEGYEGSEELEREIQEFTKEETAPYKYPRRVEFVEELPKTSSGKIRRIELREQEQSEFGE
ncbi:acyl-CoA synthetase [Halalkalicoccus subterraneus]|uniref:acyl-CoA synthetase n=1 Tax=Halalkalicoccus subterraneus TaxID=2675002 RepID=UPI000EFBA91B|nr:AMP-binding protein [Halalkalicoccus subterraneus]